MSFSGRPFPLILGSSIRLDAIAWEGHGGQCDCKNCTLEAILTSPIAVDERDWLRDYQSPEQLPVDLRIMSAKFAMSHGEIYIPTVFEPASFGGPGKQCPQDLFPESGISMLKFPGFTTQRWLMHCPRRLGPRIDVNIPLIFTDGACSNNGTPSAKSGCGFSFCKMGRPARGCVHFPLEKEGPSGQKFPPTSNRAELRAVIGALEWRYWYREGWEALVIATDSTYVADGATKWASKWVDTEWLNSKGSKVANRDLWKYLLGLVRLYAIHGCEIMIWRIGRQHNELADELAKGTTALKTPQLWISHRDPLLEKDSMFNF
ncbi:putative RNase H type-1 domain-containing protein [Seiridium cardinale]|uniref:ribonuclease H n=1 Tax=Seiridium cardinale TaxID=138064 RepID=A0ABR2XQJ1_9PEZI